MSCLSTISTSRASIGTVTMQYHVCLTYCFNSVRVCARLCICIYIVGIFVASMLHLLRNVSTLVVVSLLLLLLLLLLLCVCVRFWYVYVCRCVYVHLCMCMYVCVCMHA